MKNSVFTAIIFGISTILGSVAHQAQAIETPLINLDCQMNSDDHISAVLDGLNQQLTVNNSVFQFIKINPEGQGEALIFQKASDTQQVIASLNISELPIRLAVIDEVQASQYVCTYNKA